VKDAAPAIGKLPGRFAWRTVRTCVGALLTCVALVACSLFGHTEVRAPVPVHDAPEPAPPPVQAPAPYLDDGEAATEAATSRSTALPARVSAAPPLGSPIRLSPWPTAETDYAAELSTSSSMEPAASVGMVLPVQFPANPRSAVAMQQAPRSNETRNLTGKVSAMWLLERLWVAALVLVLLGCWLLVRARRRERPQAIPLALPRLTDEEVAFLALAWKEEPANDVAPPAAPMDLAPPEESPVDNTVSVLERPIAPAAAPEPSPPLATVFNTLSSPGGVCEQRSIGDALRKQEPIIRAAVDIGEGQGVSFKIASAVEWPLWARLHHSGVGVVSNPTLSASPLEATSTGGNEPSPSSPETPAAPTLESVAPAELVDALEAFLRLHPNDLETKREVGLSLLADAQEQTDELVRATMLDASIRILREVGDADPEAAPGDKLGEACYLRALIGADIDESLLGEAESALRAAMRRDDRLDSAAAWQLQRVLQVSPRGLARERLVERLTETCGLLRKGLDASYGASAWKGALMTAEWRCLVASCQNATERRLRFRELHANWSPAMDRETEAEVLAAWIGLLCAMAESLTGQVAMERYVEAQVALHRLHAAEGRTPRYACAFAETVLGRARLERGPARATLLREAEAMLQPYVDSDDRLRLKACRVALTQAQGSDMVAARPFYLCAIELARPLTAVPTLTTDALRCMLTALLALGEEKDRRVYARCLEIVTDSDDVDSLLLLAECQLRAGDHRAGCLHAELAWRAGGALSPAVLGLWQAAHPAWAAEEGASVEVTKNRHCLRMATSAGDRVRMAV